jgi:hypothetical protein
MQTQIWSYEDIRKEFVACQSLSEVIASLEKKFAHDGHLVCEIRVNGMYLSEVDEARFCNSTVDEIKTLQVITRTQRDLLEDSKKTVVEYIPKLCDQALRLSDNLRTEIKVQTLRDISQLMDGLSWVTEALRLLHNHLVSVHDSVRFQNWQSTESDFARLISEALQSYENADYAVLADVLEYDLTENLAKWQSLLV